MDIATSWFHERQSVASKRREEELLPGGAPRSAGMRLAHWSDAEVTDEVADQLGLVVHRWLGVQYGAAAAAAEHAGVSPLASGLCVTAAGFLLVDEGVNSALFTPPPPAYPLESHLRGVVGHLVLGLAIGLGLAVTRPLRPGHRRR